jgi:hypothetical protein
VTTSKFLLGSSRVATAPRRQRGSLIAYDRAYDRAYAGGKPSTQRSRCPHPGAAPRQRCARDVPLTASHWECSPSYFKLKLKSL